MQNITAEEETKLAFICIGWLISIPLSAVNCCHPSSFECTFSLNDAQQATEKLVESYSMEGKESVSISD